MPRMDVRADITQAAYETQMLLAVLMAEVNALRQQAGLPVRTAAQVRQALRDYQRSHARSAGGRSTPWPN